MTRRTLAALAAAAALSIMAACGSDAGEPNGQPPASGSTASTANAAFGSVPVLQLTPLATAGPLTAAAVRSGDASLYVTEQRGVVRRLRLDSSAAALDDQPVLDITSSVRDSGEQGLLGITFSPDGNDLYVAYTNKSQTQQVDRYRYDGTKADPSSRTTIITIDDFAPNHNGGDITFGPDGYLWYSMGDGGGAGDPEKNGQKTTDLLGDILRIDPRHPNGDKPYSIPSDNPFADGKGGAPEVWDYGLRNPWRYSFDRQTHDLWIADVGQGSWEEIDHVSSTKGGINFGWSLVEGTHSFNGGTAPAGAVAPVYEYDHSGGRCAVTGGFVYRGSKIPDLVGTYLFADYCEGLIHGLRLDSSGAASVASLGISVPQLSSFAQDANGELYVLSQDGTIARIDAG